MPWRCCWRSYRRFNRLPSSSALSHFSASRTSDRNYGARGAFVWVILGLSIGVSAA
jgi:hypothetical protein